MFESIDSCGSLSFSECDELIAVFGLLGPDGGTLPAGSYELSYDIFGFVEAESSCAIGCGSAGGSTTLTIIPEPGTAFLVALGLAGLAVRSRTHCT